MIVLLLLALQAPDVDAVTERIQKGGLQPPELVAAWVDKARAYVVAGEADKARRALGVALRVDPSLRVDDAALQESLAAALAELPAPDRALAGVALREGDHVTVRLVADDAGLVKGARGDGEVVPLSLEAPAATVAGTSVALVDRHGNALRVLDVIDVAPAAAPPPPPVAEAPADRSTWLSIVGASTMGIGAVGVVAAGLGYTIVGNDPAAGDVEKTALLAGTGVATAVVVLGGALVVVDLLRGGG